MGPDSPLRNTMSARLKTQQACHSVQITGAVSNPWSAGTGEAQPRPWDERWGKWTVPGALGNVGEIAPKFEMPPSQPPLNASQIPVQVEESAPKFEMQSRQPPSNSSQAAKAKAMASLRARAVKKEEEEEDEEEEECVPEFGLPPNQPPSSVSQTSAEILAKFQAKEKETAEPKEATSARPIANRTKPQDKDY